MTSSDDTLRQLLDQVAEELDRMSGYLDRLYEEMFVGTAGDASVSLLVNDVPWERVPDFDRSGPDDPHYVVSLREDGRTTVSFGDGERGRRPPATGTLELSYGRGKGAIAVLVAPNRLTVSAGVQGPAAGKVYGIQRAIVVDAQDPQARGRLLVRVPRVTGQSSVWALPCFAQSDPAALPTEGTGCWVLYEDGDVEQPVWLGELGSRLNE